MKTFWVFLFLFVLIGCQISDKKSNVSLVTDNSKGIGENIRFATGFSIESFDNYKLVEVINPWQGANDVKFQYLLYHSDTLPGNNFPDAVKIRVPIKRIICLSTTHIGFISKLNELESIVGIANKDLVYNQFLRNKIIHGELADVGYEQSLNHETLIHLQPDLIMAYGVNSEITGTKDKLRELGLTTVFNGEYLEKSPLGKAEWIKFIAAFYGKDVIADSIFNSIVEDYNNTKQLISNIEFRPNIMSGLPWKGIWYIPGKESYAVMLIEDAGGNYMWQIDSHEAVAFNIESVFELAQDADIWINPGASNSLNDIISNDERLSRFKAFNTKSVFNNNRMVNSNGGNDYWESGIVNPQIILKDLISIFHPELIPNYSSYYFKKLED